MHDHHAHAVADPWIMATLFLALPMAALVAYVVAWRRDRGWSGWRTLSFGVGIGVVMAATSPAMQGWGHRDLQGHMIQHLMLGMFAPLGLVLGAPATLLLRHVSVRTGRGIVAALGWRPVRVLLHPVTAALLDIGGMYVLYLTPLFAAAMADPALHVLLHVHFLLAGYLFTWSIAGPDPAPHRPGLRVRLVVLFLATAAHATLGKLMYGHGYPRGTGTDLTELRHAALWMYYGGDLAEAWLAVAFFAIWFRRSGTALRKGDDRAVAG